MTDNKYRTAFGAILFLIILVTLSSCGGQSAVEQDPTATPTPTKVIQVDAPTQTELPSKCAGFAGELEVQVLVGPADVVGLEPVAVGSIPIAEISGGAPYLIQGSGGINYSDILIQEWGTYEVTMNLDLTVTGECNADGTSEELLLVVEMSGTQLVVVTAEGFQGEYPWEGTQTLDLAFFLEEGASAAGEGYVIVLHLK